MPKFVSVGGAASDALKRFFIEQAITQRQAMTDQALINSRLQEEARLQNAARRQCDCSID